jgi:hypothetical protein
LVDDQLKQFEASPGLQHGPKFELRRNVSSNSESNEPWKFDDIEFMKSYYEDEYFKEMEMDANGVA